MVILRILPKKSKTIAITLFPFLLIRKGRVITTSTLNHERIHARQQLEMGIILFYLWYLVEWIVNIFRYGEFAYRMISFEREAYMNEDNQDYLQFRKFWEFTNYL